MSKDTHDHAETDRKAKLYPVEKTNDGPVALSASGTPVTQTTAMNPAAGPTPAAPAQIVPDGAGAITVDAAGQAVNQKADGTPVHVTNAQAIADAHGEAHGEARDFRAADEPAPAEDASSPRAGPRDED